MKKEKRIRADVAIGLAGVVIAIAAIAYDMYSDNQDRNPEPIVSTNSRFYCSLQADTRNGGEVWTVMYRRSSRNIKPWLRMVRTMGEDWDTKNRCQEIAGRLDIYREDGLLGFDYRDNPSTPGQYVICAKTKVSEDGCPLVVTLLPEDNPYEALREVAGALMPGSLPSYQCNDEQNCPVAQPLSINLQDQLND